MIYIGQSGRQYVPSSHPMIEGGMGDIHFVFDSMNQNVKYALKLCKEDSTTFVQRFEREIFIHQHLCGLKVGFDGVIPFVEALSSKIERRGFLMHYIEYGKSLFKWARNKMSVLPPKEQRSFLLELLLRLFRLLSEIHQKGVLHNDIKPENILVAGMGHQGSEYQIYFLDFGLAKKIDEQMTVSTIGTLGYAAPELLGRANQADQSSDIFALCLVWLEIVSGEKSFDESEYPEDYSHKQLESIWKQQISDFEIMEGPFIGANLAVLMRSMIQPQNERKYHRTSAFLTRLELCIQILDRKIYGIEQVSFAKKPFYLGWTERIGEDVAIPVRVHLQNPPQFHSQNGKILSTHYSQVDVEIQWSGLERTKHTFTPNTRVVWAIRKVGAYADIYPVSEEYPSVRVWYRTDRTRTTVQFQVRTRNHRPYLTGLEVSPAQKSGQVSIYSYDSPNIWETLSLEGSAFSPLNLEHKNALFICWDEEQDAIIDIFQHSNFQMHSVMGRIPKDAQRLQTELQARSQGRKILRDKFPFTVQSRDLFLQFIKKIELHYPNLQSLIKATMRLSNRDWNYRIWEVYGILIHCYHQPNFQNSTATDWIRLANNCLHHQVSEQTYWLLPFLNPWQMNLSPMISSNRISLMEKHQAMDIELLDHSNSQDVLDTIAREAKPAKVSFDYQINGVKHRVTLYSDEEFSVGRWHFEEKQHLPLFLSQVMPENLLTISLERQDFTVLEEFQSVVQYRRAHRKFQIIDAGFSRICPKCDVVYSDFQMTCQLHGTDEKVLTQYQGQLHTQDFQLEFLENRVLGASMRFSQLNSQFGWAYSIASRWCSLPAGLEVFLRSEDVYLKTGSEAVVLVNGTRKKRVEPNQVSIWKNETLFVPSLDLVIERC